MNTERHRVVSNYLSMVKFSHTIFAMPFAIIGFMLGVRDTGNGISWRTALFVILCMVFARTAAMSFNRWTDRALDASNPRTRTREIPAGKISAGHALIFTIVNSLLFIACTWFINTTCLMLSPVALMVILGYSYTKRFTSLCHLVLGVGLSLAPVGAYLAVTGVFALTPVLFAAAVLCWVSGFDIIYALQDEEFDRSHHLHSIPAIIGKNKALRLAGFLHILASLCLLGAGLSGQFHLFFYLGWVLFTAMLVYQHSLVSAKDLSRVNLAFFTTNGIASVLFAVLTLADILLNKKIMLI